MKDALLLIDLQNDYFEGGANPLTGSLWAVNKAKKVLDYYRKQKELVVHIQHVANREGATFFIKNTLGVSIHEAVYPIATEKVIVKHFPNSFRETDLLEYLQARGVTNLCIAGMMTQMCVDATVRAAKDYGFDCCLLADACATKDLQFGGVVISAPEVQFSFVAALSYFYAEVLTVDQFLRDKLT